MLDGALIAVGTLAVVDNVVVHWLLGWHRLVQQLSHQANLVGEILLVALGIAMVSLGVHRLRRR